MGAEHGVRLSTTQRPHDADGPGGGVGDGPPETHSPAVQVSPSAQPQSSAQVSQFSPPLHLLSPHQGLARTRATNRCCSSASATFPPRMLTAPTGPQTCPEQYCPATSARKLVNAEKLLLPSNGLRKDAVDCSTDPNYELVTLDTYIPTGRSDVLIELKGPADPSYALNLVIAAPHGGSLKPDYIDTRSGSGIVTSKDSYTLEMSELTANSLIRDCAGTPYVVINNLHRSKLDANRDLDEATAGIVRGLDDAADAWRAFHTFITAAQELVKVKYGTSEGSTGLIGVNGLFFDMHVSNSSSVIKIKSGGLFSSPSLLKHLTHNAHPSISLNLQL